jgi:DNA-binding response OmpR family regulator
MGASPEKTIIYLEDRNIGDDISEVLNTHGYHCVRFTTEPETLLWIQNNGKPDLLLVRYSFISKECDLVKYIRDSAVSCAVLSNLPSKTKKQLKALNISCDVLGMPFELDPFLKAIRGNTKTD